MGVRTGRSGDDAGLIRLCRSRSIPMRRWLPLFTAALFSGAAAVAQPAPGSAVVDQQQALQALLDQAIVAIRQNDAATACRLRGQALNILNSNIQAFQAAFPANDWSDLQTSLQGSLVSCGANGM